MYPESPRNLLGRLGQFVLHRLVEGERWNAHGRVPGMNTGVLDVFHQCPDEHILSIADTVNLDFPCSSQEF